jgi:endonuclease/exonuclease/phosphatase family metal-dependent hydrolase
MHLRVASLNVWALPWGMARDTRARMRAIGNALPGLDVDVVAFQEAWTEEARRTLVAAGARAGLVQHWSNRGELGSSGLLVLSRLPIAEARFDPYLLRGYPERIWEGDYWGGKGFALLGLKTPDGPLAFVDTHLHAQYREQVGDEYSGLIMGQVVQLAAALAGVSVPLVAAGDFNLRPDQPHYPALLGLGGLRDAAVEGGDTRPTSLNANPYHHPHADARIDYVFVRDGGGHRIRVRSAARVFDEPLQLGGRLGALSDHAGLRVELEIGKGGVRAAPLPSAEAIALARTALVKARHAAEARRGQMRAGAAAALGGAGVALVGARSTRLERRRFLRTLVVGGGLLALPVGCGLTALSERSESRALEAYEILLHQLDDLDRTGRARGSARARRSSRLAPAAAVSPV